MEKMIKEFLARAGEHPEKIKLAKLGNDPDCWDNEPDMA
jgi:hypothetical protein